MNRQSLTFIITFLIAASAAGHFVYAGDTLYGLVAGIVGLLIHWALSGGGDRDGEVADSSYFLGFLLTLVFLAVGVYRLGARPSPGSGGAGVDNTAHVLGFLVDLAGGLALTITGLLIRQVRTLASQPVAAEVPPLEVTQRKLADNIAAMIELWRARPEHQVLEELQQSRFVTRDATERLDQSVTAAAKSMLGSVERLDDAAGKATDAMTRAAAAVGASMTRSAERLEADLDGILESLRDAVTGAITAIDRQRSASDEALDNARTVSQQMMSEAESFQQQQLDLWRTNLEEARNALQRAHLALDDEYRRGLEGFKASGEAFAALTAKTTTYVQALPNPAERLAGLWDGVRSLETDLTEAISGSVEGLAILRERSEQLSHELAQLGESAGAATERLGSTTTHLAGTLQHELHQMNTVIDQYVNMLENTVRFLKVRV